MRRIVIAVSLAMLAGCGVETATTAATSAALKKQEIDAGKKTQEQVQQNLEQSMRQAAEQSHRE